MAEDKPKQEKPKQVAVNRKQMGNMIFESAVVCNMPNFLVVDISGRFSTNDSLAVDDLILSPKLQNSVPYRQYEISASLFKQLQSGQKIDKEELYQKVKAEIDTYIDADEKHKVLIAAQIFESYMQHKLTQVGYLYVTGEQESGKTRVCKIIGLLSYRVLSGISINAANVYRYLGTDVGNEGHCTIIEDEIDPKADDKKDAVERNKIYRAGYQKGNRVPRIADGSSSEAEQKYYLTFCTKTLSGYSVPYYDPALNSRCIELPMSAGAPPCDDDPEKRVEAFDKIKALLLAWRMQTYFELLPYIETHLRNRTKEKWLCKLYALHGTSGYNTMLQFAEQDAKEAADAKANSIEAHALKALFDVADDDFDHVTFKWLWDKLKLNLGVDKDTEMPITKKALGSIINSKFHGEKAFTPAVGRYYSFNKSTLMRIAKSYGILKEEKTIVATV